MEGVVKNFDHSSQPLFVFKSVGDICIKMLGLASGIEKFVWGESGSQEVDKQDCIDNNSVSSSFVAATQNLLYFHLSLLKSDKELFRDFNDFTVKCGKPIETVLSSSRDVCRKCGRKLVFENKAIPVVIYSDHRGTYLRSRLTKMCRKCKIYEHHRYWSVDGKRHFHRDSVLSEFLLSSEDTAFQMDVLAECNNLLVIGTVSFSTYAASYNRRFQYCKMATTNDIDPTVKRMKRYVDNYCKGKASLGTQANCI